MKAETQNYLIDKNQFQNFLVEDDSEDFDFELDSEISENEILVYHNK